MMKKQVSPRDLEKLSAYLDEQLNARQRTRIQARLHDEPEFAEALSNLKRTRSILRAAPRLKVPHNFSLTPEMTVQRQRVQVQGYVGFRMASALATFLFVLVVAGDLIGFSNRFAAPELVQPQIIALQEDKITQPMEKVEAHAAVAVDASDPEPPEAESYAMGGEPNAEVEIEERSSEEAAAPKALEESGENMREADVADEETVAIEESQPAEEEGIPLLMEAAPAEKSVGAYPGEAVPETAGIVAGGEMPDETSVGETGGEEQDEMMPVDEEILRNGEWSSDDETDQETVPEVDLPQHVDLASRSGWSLLRVLEIVLGFTALGTGLAALYYYRRGHNAG